MKKKLLYSVVFMLIVFGCRYNNKGNYSIDDTLLLKKNTLAAKVDTPRNNLVNPDLNAQKNWANPLIQNYINHSNNDLVKLAIKDNILEEWLFDQTINTDTAKYFIFQIGHDVLDSGKMNLRFVTDCWIYIDSLTSKIYEYDLANDSLIAWENKDYKR